MNEPPATVAIALRDAAARLAATSDTPRLDAELLMAHALGVSRSAMLLSHMGVTVPKAFAALRDRRTGHEPVGYILGRAEFYGLELEVSPAVLIPRADSETLIEVARAAFAQSGAAPQRILDLGTGSGCLLLAALSIWPNAEGRGIDRSLEALTVAMRNCQRHANTATAVIGDGPSTEPARRGDRGFAHITQRDWAQPGWAEGLGTYDLILANPPYVEDAAPLAPDVRDHEPAGALFAGPEGLDDYRALVPRLPALLAPGGLALVEIGHRQAEAVSAIARAVGLSARLHYDLGGRQRALELSREVSGKTRGGD